MIIILNGVIFQVFYEPEVISEEFANSPFNLKKDCKYINEEEMIWIAENVQAEAEANRKSDTYSILYKCNANYKITYCKIRTEDKTRRRGKSGGYRVIALVDREDNLVFILHVYRHSHGEDDNISPADKNKLKKLIDEYNTSKREAFQ